jgi:molybdate transport system substrate-binding protein
MFNPQPILLLLATCAMLRGSAAEIEQRKPATENPPPATVSIAAASDLVFCLEALDAEFSRGEPAVRLTVVTGSSGNFFAQIRNGAPFDVFLSADLRYPRELIAAGAADAASLTRYALGRLVLWTTRKDLDPASLAAVANDLRVKKFAIANPAHAPYGRAAREALEALGVWAAVQPRLVLGENIAQTAQFVETGNADAGIVALSLVAATPLRDVGRWAEIPSALHAPLEQGAVLTTHGAANAAAGRYLAFLRSAVARSIFDRFGFRLPPAEKTDAAGASVPRGAGGR